jgi:hypothetical protein
MSVDATIKSLSALFTITGGAGDEANQIINGTQSLSNLEAANIVAQAAAAAGAAASTLIPKYSIPALAADGAAITLGVAVLAKHQAQATTNTPTGGMTPQADEQAVVKDYVSLFGNFVAAVGEASSSRIFDALGAALTGYGLYLDLSDPAVVNTIKRLLVGVNTELANLKSNFSTASPASGALNVLLKVSTAISGVVGSLGTAEFLANANAVTTLINAVPASLQGLFDSTIGSTSETITDTLSGNQTTLAANGSDVGVETSVTNANGSVTDSYYTSSIPTTLFEQDTLSSDGSSQTNFFDPDDNDVPVVQQTQNPTGAGTVTTAGQTLSYTNDDTVYVTVSTSGYVMTINNLNGTSTAYTYTGPNFSSPTWALAQIDQENAPAGTSIITNYTPMGSSDAISYAGPNGTGNATSSVLSVANGDRLTASVNTPNETVTFAGPYGVLNLANPATFVGTISNFTNSASTTSDSINLAGISATDATFGANNVLAVQTGTGAIDLRFASGQNLSAKEFTVSPDGNGGTEVLLGRAYVYTGHPFTSSPDASPFTPGNVVLSVTVSPNIPANFTGEVNANGGGIVWWTASAYGQTISPANANNEQTSIFVTFANGTPTSWSFEVENFSTLPNFITFMDSGGKDGNLDDVQSSPKEGLTGTPGVWTIGVPPPGGDIVQTPTSLTTIAAGITWTVSGNTSVANLVNNGTIVIPNGASLQVTSRLVEDAGSTITGVVAGAGASTTIELAAGKSGSISSGLSNIGTIAIDASASWTVTGSYSLPNIVDNGAIVLASGASLQVSSRLVEGAGSAITGVVAGVGAGTTVELAAGKSGSISSGLSNIGTIAIDAGASWTVTGSYSLPNIIDNGTIAITNGASLAISSALDPSSSGIFQLTGQSTLEIAAALGTNAKIQFLGSAPTNKLTIDSAANFGTGVGTAAYKGLLLQDFTAGDVIDLKGIASAGLQLAYTATSGILQVTKSGGGAAASLLFDKSTLGAGSFRVAADGSGGSLITHS